MLRIKIIVSQPYCPASDLLLRRVKEILGLRHEDKEITVHVEKCDNIVVLDEWEASRRFGFDRRMLDALYRKKAEQMDGLYHPADLYTKESEMIRQDLLSLTNQNDAMLAPILFIDENILAEGVCPDPCEIDAWISNYFNENQ